MGWGEGPGVCYGCDDVRASQAGEKVQFAHCLHFLMQPGWEIVGNKSVGRWTDCPQRKALVPPVPLWGEGISVGDLVQRMLWAWARGSCRGFGVDIYWPSDLYPPPQFTLLAHPCPHQSVQLELSSLETQGNQ